MKSKRKVETAIVDSMKSAEAFMDWCECNDHKVIEIAVTYEVDGLAREDDEGKVRYVDTILEETEPVSISRISTAYMLIPMRIMPAGAAGMILTRTMTSIPTTQTSSMNR